MKARVKATGEIVEVEPTFVNGDKIYSWVSDNGYFYTNGSLDFESLTEKSTDVKEKSLPKDEPDYWEKLKHQYAGMAMQGILSSDKILGILGMQKGKELKDMIGDMSVKIATALVNRLKEEEK